MSVRSASTREQQPRRVLVSAVLALAMFATACSSGSAGAPATDGADTETPVATDPETGAEPTNAGEGEMTPVTVINPGGAAYQPAILAEELGFFEEAGLDVTLEEGAGNPAANVPLLLNNQAQFAALGVSQVIQSTAGDVPIRMVSSLQNATIDAPEEAINSGFLVPPDSPISSLGDLEGATVGIHALGSTVQVLANNALLDAGVDIDSIEWVQLPLPNLGEAALNGQVDAIVTFAVFWARATRQQGFTPIRGASAEEIYPGLSQIAWAASEEFLADNPDVAATFVEVMDRATTYATENPDAVRDVDREVTELPEAYIEAYPLATYDTTIHLDVLASFAGDMFEQGFTEGEPNVDMLVWDQAPTN